MDWAGIFVGALVGMALPYSLSTLRRSAASWRTRRRWKKLNLGLGRVDQLLGRLEVIQTGWVGGAFREEDMQITLEGVYQLPEEIRLKVLEPSEAAWRKEGFRDNIQCGVRSLHIGRTTDDAAQTEPSHEILIAAHKYRYFECKATNFEWSSGGEHRELLSRYTVNARHDHHASEFPTPLSVGLSLFCEDGRSLVLTHRTAMPGAGGHISPGLYFNAVGENCVPIDTRGEFEGRTRFSIFRTATRGLLEEMGIDLRQVTGAEPKLHSLTWDPDMLDYKFFGYVVCALAGEEVRALWRHAADKSESRSVEIVDVHDKAAAIRLVSKMSQDRDTWSDEARVCTIMSLVHVGRLSFDDLAAIAG